MGLPKLKLARLRDIGWSAWDPIGLLGDGESWDDQPFADEYDSYLMQAAGELRRGASLSDVVDFLVHIESEHMGMGVRHDAKERATKVAWMIQSDKELWTERN